MGPCHVVELDAGLAVRLDVVALDARIDAVSLADDAVLRASLYEILLNDGFGGLSFTVANDRDTVLVTLLDTVRE